MGGGQSYPVAEEAYDLELFNLICAFAASKELANLGRDGQGINRLRATFEQSEAARRLIAVAIMARGKLDTRSVIRPKRLKKDTQRDVGRLVRDITQPSRTEPLEFRKACDKIIHAVLFDLTIIQEPDEPESASVLSLTVTLWGARGSCQWRAEIDMPHFVEAASNL